MAQLSDTHASHVQHRLTLSLFIAVGVALIELVGGLLSNSLALLGDAGHVGADAVALGLAVVAMKLAARPHTSSSTYGYHRMEVIAALVNGVTLFLVSGYILYEAYLRFSNPPHVAGQLLLIVAAIGLAANIGMALLLKEDSRLNINVRGAFLHVLSDTLSSVGVMVGGVAIIVAGLLIVDVVVAVFIGALILRSGISLVKDTVSILLEQAPKGVDTQKVIDEFTKVEGVQSVHELHIWSLTSGMYVLSAHVVIDEHHRDHEVLDSLNRILREKFRITHTTIQIDHKGDAGLVSIDDKKDS